MEKKSFPYLRFDGPKIGKYHIRINNKLVKVVKKEQYLDYNLLSDVFDKWLRINYPPFCKNPIRWLFGGKKNYNTEGLYN